MERLKHIDKIIVVGELAAIAWILLGSNGFPAEVREYTNKRDGECKECGIGGSLEAHHICYKSVAKKHKVPSKFYHHPANARMLCADCHDYLHDDDRELSLLQELEMIRDMYQRIVDFYVYGEAKQAQYYPNSGQLHAITRGEDLLDEANERLVEIQKDIDYLIRESRPAKKKAVRKSRKHARVRKNNKPFFAHH